MNAELILEQGINQLGVSVEAEALLEYLALLIKWNKTYNLTAIKQPKEMVVKHLLDSLAIVPHIKGDSVIDVGTGAGLPGIPLALCYPDKSISLLDSNGKKTRFLQQVKRTLGLSNIEIIQIRSENYHPKSRFDTVVSRAFASIEQMIEWTKHLITPDGQWLAMKGKQPDNELTDLAFPQRVTPLTIPGLSDDRCLVIINNQGNKS